MTEKQILRWIHENLSADIKKAITGTVYTEDWLGGMAMRETGFLIARYIKNKIPVKDIHALMKGDYSQRHGELEKSYHGFGYWQIDIDSYPEFVKSGTWKDPYQTALKAVSVLDEKAKDLLGHGIKSDDAITAAYNCGAYNVRKGLVKAGDPDIYTHEHNYSKEVQRYRAIYREVMQEVL